MGDIEKCLKKPEILVSIVILLIIILYLVFGRSENYSESGIGNNYQVYTSGATVRRLGQKFTSTNQGVYTTIHNADISGVDDKPVEVVIFPAKRVPSFLVSKN